MGFSHRPPSVLRDLRRIRSTSGRGVYASDGKLFRHALFGRDALEFCEDLIEVGHPLARQITTEVLVALAQLQGTRWVPDGPRTSEEEPGRISHEARWRIVDGRVVDAAAQALLHELTGKWGGQDNNPDQLLYYGTIDATPEYARVLAMFCDTFGPAAADELLATRILTKDAPPGAAERVAALERQLALNPADAVVADELAEARAVVDEHTVTMRDSWRAALSWIESRVNGTPPHSAAELARTAKEAVPPGVPRTSLLRRVAAAVVAVDTLGWRVAWDTLRGHLPPGRSGLVEGCRRNPLGIGYQYWMDGYSYIHADGGAANMDRPIASVEVQGIAYDAFRGASRWLHQEFPRHAVHWRRLAEQLQRRTLDILWMPEHRYFAQGLDRDAAGQPRLIRTLTSNAASLLNSGIFETLSARQREYVITGIVEMITSPEFMTEVGVRCRALRHRHLLGFDEYQGTSATWFKETYDIAKGLRRYGFPALAREFENRILNGTNITGENIEYLFVDGNGRIDYDPRRLRGPEYDDEIITTNDGDAVQAWTVSAVTAIKWRRSCEVRAARARRRIRVEALEVASPRWRGRLESGALQRIGTVPVFGRTQCRDRFTASRRFFIDLDQGNQREMRARAANGRVGRPDPPPASLVQRAIGSIGRELDRTQVG